jgi:hypothetical protein
MNEELSRIQRLLRWRVALYAATAADGVIFAVLCALALIERTALYLLPIVVAALVTLPLAQGARAVSRRAGARALRLAPRLTGRGPTGGQGPARPMPAQAPC